MQKEHITGKVDELAGKAKQGIGQATNNPGLKGEGLVDEAKGKAKQAYGDFKDTVQRGDRQAGTEINNK